ncbi:MAG: diacylglycerol/lipid kinase family protein [Coriobacteriaceae bacterium]
MDAAIALDTMDRRQKSGRAGTMLYLESAVDQLFHHLQVFSFKMDVLGAEPGCAPHPEWDDAYLVAVQVGPTYGGHFRITPKARLDDGLLDIAGPRRSCPCGRWRSSARPGRQAHGSDHIHFGERPLVLDFEEEPPAQMDGSRFTARTSSSTASPTPHRRCGPAVGHEKDLRGRGLRFGRWCPYLSMRTPRATVYKHRGTDYSTRKRIRHLHTA